MFNQGSAFVYGDERSEEGRMDNDNIIKRDIQEAGSESGVSGSSEGREVARCVHGAEIESHKKWPDGLGFACPICTCSCCKSLFTYIDQCSFTSDIKGKDKTWSRIWTPNTLCGECGGKYVEKGESPWVPMR